MSTETRAASIPKRIVIEINRHWPSTEPKNPLISERFQDAIAENATLGFNLESWQMNTTFLQDSDGNAEESNETIVAVFVEVQ